MNSLYYQTRIFTSDGRSVTLTDAKKELERDGVFETLAQHPNGIMALSRVKRIERLGKDALWLVTAEGPRSVHATKETHLRVAGMWKSVDNIVPEETFLQVGPNARTPMEALSFTLRGVLRRDNDKHFNGILPMTLSQVKTIKKSPYMWEALNHCYGVEMEEVDNFIITSGLIIKSNGDDN